MDRAAQTRAGVAESAFGTGGKANGAVVLMAEGEALLRAVAKANGAVVVVREVNALLGEKFEASGDSANFAVSFLLYGFMIGQ